MSKKHEMTEHEYQIYKKKHQYEDVEDIEQGKIKREKSDLYSIPKEGYGTPVPISA
jgi:hypothetical protein